MLSSKSMHRVVLRFFSFSLLFVLSFSVPVQAVLVERVLGVVSGEIITLSDVQIALQFHLTDLFPAPGISLPDAALKQVQEKVLRRLIDRKLLLTEARKFSITADGISLEEVEREIGRIRTILTQEGYEEALRRWAIPEADLIRRVREKITVEKFLSFRIQFFAVVSPADILKYYNDHQAEFGGRSVESVQGDIEKILSAQEAERMLEEYLVRLRGQAKIQINSL